MEEKGQFSFFFFFFLSLTFFSVDRTGMERKEKKKKMM